MKIAHVVESFGGGVYSFLVDLCNGLCEDNEVILIYSKRDQTPENFEMDFSSKVKLINLQMIREVKLKRDFSDGRKLYKLLKEEKPDVVHFHSSKCGVLGRFAGRLLGYKRNQMFYNPHGYAFLQENISSKKRKFYKIVEKFMTKIGGTIVGCSKGEYEESLKLSKHSKHIDNAINTKELDKYMVDNNKEIKTIGTIGRVSYQKNPKLFNEVAKLFPGMQFIWIGGGDLENELTSPNIKVTGWMDRYDAIKMMNNIDIYIQTSLWEGLPIALLEGMYMKKLVIATNVIGNRDVVIEGETGFLASKAEEFEKAINKLKDNNELYEKVRNNAQKYIIDNHMINDMVNNYKKLYNNSL